MRRVLGVLAAILVGFASMAPLAGAAESESLDWLACPERIGPQAIDGSAATAPIECARLRVPLDHDEPDGKTISIAVRRWPAPAGPQARRGSLILNPGGPGSSPRSMLLGVGLSGLFDEWDLIAPDPRGIGQSTALSCETAPAANVGPVNFTGDRYLDVPASVGAFVDSCLTAEDGELFSHLGTLNVAKDFDLLRAALGEEKLDYYGASYGTHVGAVYSVLFPERVGRFILDGPVLLDDVPGAVQGQIVGFEDSLDRFDAACSATASCPLRIAGAKRVWRHLSWRLNSRPGEVEGVAVGRDALIAASSRAFNVGRSSWPAFAAALQDAFDGDYRRLVSFTGSDGGSSSSAYLAVMCSDDPSRPTAYDARRRARDEIQAGNESFANIFGPGIARCANVPVSDEPVPELNSGVAHTAMLVIAKTHDPATPYAGALRFAEQMKSSRLLTVNDDGHTAVATGNACVDDAVAAYLASGALPEKGASCVPGGLIGISISGEGSNGGLVVASIVEGSAADGVLLVDDEILTFNGVKGRPTVTAGLRYEIDLIRNGERLTVDLIAGGPQYWLE